VERVVELRGQLIEASEDSVLIQVSDVKFPDGRIERFGEEALASFSHAEVTMEEVEFSGGKTALLVVGLGILLVVLMGMAVSTVTEEVFTPSPKY
jgi:hypothetical protein